MNNSIDKNVSGTLSNRINNKNNLTQVNNNVEALTTTTIPALKLNNPTSSTAITSSARSRQNNQQQLNSQQQQKFQQKRIKSSRNINTPSNSHYFGHKVMDKSSETFINSEFFNKQIPLPSFYYVNIGRQGTRTMDLASHIGPAEIGSNSESAMSVGGEKENGPRPMTATPTSNSNCCSMEHVELKLRPISGVRNHLKRNNSAHFNTHDRDLLHETDLVDRLMLLRHSLKRLDLSHNNLTAYPLQLCTLHLLETLNLSGNHLTETDFPTELELLQNLTELVLDDNSLRHIPKSLAKCKKISRLSVCNNELIDLKNIEPLKRLRTLVLDSNSLTQLDDSLRSLEKLEYLHVSNNAINSIQFSLFKSHLNAIRQLDLSSNRLQAISTELFMLPHLEWLNVSNNSITRLPAVQSTSHVRAIPIYSLDLSGNYLSKFYDYVLHLALVVDLSANRLKTLPKKTISRLTENEISHRVLRLDANPLIDPPLEVCVYGLKSIQEYFENESRHVQLNKGFKIILLGESKSGKTSLANALEDFHTKSNLMEQYQTDSADCNESESKLVEIHEFYMNTSDESDESRDQVIQSSVQIKPSNEERRGSKIPPTIQRPRSSVRRNSSAKSARMRKNSEINSAFAISKLPLAKKPAVTFESPERITSATTTMTTTEAPKSKKQILPVTIYDFNGSFAQYAHLFDTFLDKSALIILCIDSCKVDQSVSYLTDLLDFIFLKLSKATSFTILPVLTKSDLVTSQQQQTATIVLRQTCERVEAMIANHLRMRLNEIRVELKKIESLAQINTSQSDRLKQLAQIQANLNPDVYRSCVPVSSMKMSGFEQLAEAVKEIVFNSSRKIFADVNKKVPVFWTEVENFACNKLAELPSTKNISESGKIKWTQPQTMNIFCIDYNEYKEKIVEKYGMSHLVEQITKYMSASGRILWFQESEKLKRKVFLRPSLLFDLLFVLFRSRFHENFSDAHLQALRMKLVRESVDTSEANVLAMSERFLHKGHVQIDLLKLIWFPLLITDSTLLLKRITLVLMDLFHIGYPVIGKDKLKILMNAACSGSSLSSSHQRRKSQTNQEVEILLGQINEIIVPMYLPPVSGAGSAIERARTKFRHEWSQAINMAIHNHLKKATPKLVSKIVQRYTFQWGLMPGVFEKFTVSCLFNSDLYYISHYRNFVLAYNEDNTIGVIIHTNWNEEDKKLNEVTFEFYLVSYTQILESLQESNKMHHRRDDDENFEQTISMDLDQIWVLALRVLHIFEETILNNFPSLRYDRWSQCPQCENFSFMGEWLTPKDYLTNNIIELQKLKSKVCPNCHNTIDCSFLVKPSSSQNLALDMKKIHQRLENIARMHEARVQYNLNHQAANNTSQSKSESKTTFSTSEIN